MANREHIDALCKHTMSPTVLNALHACRDGHPLGRDNPWKWRTALALVQQHTIEFLSADTGWLERMADKEATA